MSLVEYHDPDELFPVISPHLFARLPLRNLHWKSPSRPLRSIESLHVDFEPAQVDEHDKITTKSTSGLTESNDNDPSPVDKVGPESGPTASNLPKRTRRHQIPGLRQTPFLKLYILRCDDNETYKSSARKLIREWLRKNSPSSQSSSGVDKQENHDAFDWLILHVVLPDTPAAAQPRWSKKQSSAESDVLKEKPSGSSRWTGRGSSTILEKIRADFNLSSKSAPDRVAQVRLQKDAIPAYLLPALPPVGVTPVNETPKEQENAWNDLISKFKTLILMSFTLRVGQYEEDVREKDAQRTLPGWNFNTFFLLKEGLSMAFESVGLTEDALRGYDELEIGLETTIRDLDPEAQENSANIFPAYTPELRDIMRALTSSTSPESSPNAIGSPHFRSPLSAVAKNYRERIVANDISIFDFRCYIFARQMSLLLRLARGIYPHSQKNSEEKEPSLSSKSTDGTHITDVTQLVELAQRGNQFASSNARLMRSDIMKSISSLSAEQNGLELAINAIISTWNFTVLQQLLDETFVSDLALQSSVQEYKARRSPNRKVPSPSRRPQPSPSRLRAGVSDPNSYEEEALSFPQASNDKHQNAGSVALESLAANRAELLLAQRRILQSSCKHFGYSIASRDFRIARSYGPDDPVVGRNGETNSKLESPLGRMYQSQLREALQSEERSKAFYELLSDRAAQNYMLANREKAAEKVNVDLAILKYNSGDFAAAANYFGRSMTLYSDQKWNLAESSLLELHAKCLKALHRRDEYVRTMLLLLAKSADARRSASLHSTEARDRHLMASLNSSGWLNDTLLKSQDILTDLVEYSRDLPYDVTISTSEYFQEIQVEPCIRLFEQQDGFQLLLKVQQLLANEISIDSARVRLVNTSAGQIQEIWAESDAPLTLSSSITELWLSSNVTTNGRFIVDYIALRIGRIVFVQETLAKTDVTTTIGASSATSVDSIKAVKEAAVICYPRNGAFNADLNTSSTVQLGRSKMLCLCCQSGFNEVLGSLITLKSASAGLRLRTAESRNNNGDTEIVEKSKPGVIQCGKFLRGSTSEILVPYDVENGLDQISVRMDIHYTTSQGEYRFISHVVVKIGLAINVNVQDLFKENALYSKFFFKPTSRGPVHIVTTSALSSENFDIRGNTHLSLPTVVAFKRQPACISYKIIRKSASSSQKSESQKERDSLSLAVQYFTAEDAITSLIVDMMSNDLETSQLQYFRRLLLPFLKDRLYFSLSGEELDKAVWIGQVEIPSFDQVGWSDIMAGVSPKDRDDLEMWLQEWHKANMTASLRNLNDHGQDDNRNIKKLLIDVDVPQVQYLHTTELRLHAHNRSKTLVASVGQPLVAQLSIRHTRRWNLQSRTREKDQDYPLAEFFCEVLADPASWLVSGQRRAYFAAAEDENVTFEVILIPLRAGQLLLPAVDVKLAASNNEQANNTSQTVPCETDFASQGQTVWVLEKMDSVTLGLGELEADQVDRTPMVIESEWKVYDVER